MAEGNAKRAAIGTPTYAVQGGLAGAIGVLIASRWAEWFPNSTPAELAAVATVAMWVVTVGGHVLRDWLHRRNGTSTIAPLLLIAFVAPALWFSIGCASQTPRQQFYLAEVGFAGAQGAAVAYLKTPYGEQAPEAVLTAISEASAEGTATLQRLRPLVPGPGEEIPDRNEKLLEAGLDTLESIAETLTETVFAPEQYEEK